MWALGQNVAALPSLIEMGKTGLLGAAAAGTAGAGIGFVTGGLPGAAALGLAGLAWGGKTGFAEMGAAQTFGNTYDMYRKAGLNHQQSMAPAVAAGLVAGVLNSVNFLAVGKVTKDAFLKNLAAKEANSLRVNYVKSFAQTVGINLGVGQIQNAANLTFQAASAAINKNADAMPTWHHVAEAAGQTALNGIVTAPIAVGTAMSAGAAAGAGFRMLSGREAPTLEESLTNIRTGLNKKIPTSEEEFQKNMLQGHLEENTVQEPKTPNDYKNAVEAAQSNKERMQAEALDIKRQVKAYTKEGQDVPEQLIADQRNANKAARKANKEYKFAKLSAALGKDVKSMSSAERNFQERQLALKDLENEYIRLQTEQNVMV
jgi:hypothetical protein